MHRRRATESATYGSALTYLFQNKTYSLFKFSFDVFPIQQYANRFSAFLLCY